VTLVPSSDPATESVAEGKIGMVITLVSEIMPVKGLQVVGEIPAEFQSYISFIAATNAKSTNTAASGALIAFLKSPKAAPVYKAKGMEAR
jgi:molybdate transport system substrate-binding protein